MPEGLSPSEVGKEISEHRARVAEEAEKEGSATEAKGRDWPGFAEETRRWALDRQIPIDAGR